MRRANLALFVACLLLAIADSALAGKLTVEGSLDNGASFSSYLVSYRSDGLKVHAMIAVPKQPALDDGFPVVVANHGYVPDPSHYGITADGVDSRPGDYYRSVPELFASRGFLVVMPDYRGHNSSEGFEFVHKADSVDLYADDVIALVAALDEIEFADTDNIFMWSHSMGGGVSMRTQLATDNILAASYWATMDVTDLASQYGHLDGAIMIQHSSGDKSTQHSNSEQLSTALSAIDHPHVHHSYDSDDHYFVGAMRELAADRDATFFRSLMH